MTTKRIIAESVAKIPGYLLVYTKLCLTVSVFANLLFIVHGLQQLWLKRRRRESEKCTEVLCGLTMKLVLSFLTLE